MITQQQNEYLCQTGPGTPMGELFRRYWIPALLSDELPRPNCPPVRVQLLSERLIAFRDTEGRIGVMDEFCAHRGVSLWFGRNEESGLRCPYHGWKYDVTGQCIEVPSEPASSGFCQKIKLKSYPTIDLGGVIWVYMGPSAEQPPAPDFEWVHLPKSPRVHQQALAGIQLPASHGGRHRFESRLLPPPLRSRSRSAPPQHRRRAAYPQHQHGVRHSRVARRAADRRPPQRRSGSSLLAHHPVAVPLVHADPALQGQRAQRPCLGADG